jgi:pimeloyl-ACP methyl ester carboxylesterase
MPGMGGSRLYNKKHQQIWPPDLSLMNLKNLNIEFSQDGKMVIPSPHPVGNVNDVIIDNPATFLLTKNVYYKTKIKFLQNAGHQVFGFPYDFRFILHPEYYEPLYVKYLDFLKQKNTRFIIVCHSLGGLVMQHFLALHEEAIKYIEKIYFINVPWGGCPISFYTIYDHAHPDVLKFAGPSSLIKILNHRIKTMHLFSGFYASLPITEDSLIKKSNVVYSGTNYSMLIKQDFLYEKLLDDYLKARKQDIRAPNNMIYSDGINTTFFFDMDKNITKQTNGDGVIPLSSLTFFETLGYDTNSIRIPNYEHSKINSYVPLLRMISNNKDELIF